MARAILSAGAAPGNEAPGFFGGKAGRPLGLREPGLHLVSPPGTPLASDHLLRTRSPRNTIPKADAPAKKQTPFRRKSARKQPPFLRELPRWRWRRFSQSGVYSAENRGPKKGSPGSERPPGPRRSQPSGLIPEAKPPRPTPATLRASRRQENPGNRELAAGAVEKVTSAPEANRPFSRPATGGFRQQEARGCPDPGWAPSHRFAASSPEPRGEGDDGGGGVPPSLIPPLQTGAQVPDPPLFQAALHFLPHHRVGSEIYGGGGGRMRGTPSPVGTGNLSLEGGRRGKWRPASGRFCTACGFWLLPVPAPTLTVFQSLLS